MSAYLEALKMLARRELSEAQKRQRLSKRGEPPESIDEAVTRLKAERSIDDERVAGAIARSETSLRKRGRRRVQQQIEAAGISRAVAARAVDETFQELDPDALLTASLARRLRGRERIADEREFQRLFRYLSAQGFDSDRILAHLRRLQ
jgi:SOS response regulatory protein OraA/RecX